MGVAEAESLPLGGEGEVEGVAVGGEGAVGCGGDVDGLPRTGLPAPAALAAGCWREALSSSARIQPQRQRQ